MATDPQPQAPEPGRAARHRCPAVTPFVATDSWSIGTIRRFYQQCDLSDGHAGHHETRHPADGRLWLFRGTP